MASSYATASGGGTAPHEVVVRAYKAEIQQLKEALHEVALRDTGSGISGFNEVLEGKYLAQIKKNRTLSVQLGTAQQQLADAQKALQVEQEKTKRLVAAATSTATGNSQAGRQARRSSHGNPSSNDDGSLTNDGDADGDDAAEAKSTDGASAAVRRVYDQLHQREVALAEVHRENTALRSLVQREVGLRNDTTDVDALLRRTASTASNGGGDGGGAAAAGSAGSGTSSNNSGNTVSSAGWRGRAEEIVLLKSKLKDAQRKAETMAAAAAAAEEDGQYSDEGSGADSRQNCTSNCSDPLALPASVRAYLGMEEHAPSETRSTAMTATTAATTTTTRRRDVDDAARDRLAALQQQRATQQRQQAADAEKQQRQLQEEKLRTAALQARVKTMKEELDTLRAYVETILDKSTTDDELIDAYKTELSAAQEEIQAWKRKVAEAAASNAHVNHTPSDSAVAGVKNGADASMAVAAARSAPYRKAAQLELFDAQAAPSAASVASPPTPPPQQQTLAMQSIDAVVYEWVLRACQETPAVEKGCAAATDAGPADAPPSTDAVAAVLRSALHHVAQVERETTTAASAAQLMSLATKNENSCAGENASSAAATAQIQKVIVAENAALKKRLHALTDLMEREMQAQKVLWSSKESKEKS